MPRFIIRLLLLFALATSAVAYVSVITGANGFVGRHVVHSLLQQSDDTSVIICLVRENKVPQEALYWCAQTDDMDRNNVCIKVMSYDMLDNGKTLLKALEAGLQNSASKSCQICVYHVASSFGPTPDPIQTAKDNVQSTEDAVRELDKFYQSHPEIKPRIVVTSSMAAVRATDQTPLNQKHYTYKDWNTLSKLNADNWGSCYQWSKAESERRAWELVKECNDRYAREDDGKDSRRKIEMVALCPSFVFGPPPPLPTKIKDTTIASSSSYSLTLINQWLEGKSPVQSRLCADVRDVANAHVVAGTMKQLPGDNDSDRRYILSTEERLTSEATAQALIKGVERARKENQQASSSIEIDPSEITCDNEFTGGAIKIGDREVEASERLERDLGVVCRSVEETFQDMAEQIVVGILTFKE